MKQTKLLIALLCLTAGLSAMDTDDDGGVVGEVVAAVVPFDPSHFNGEEYLTKNLDLCDELGGLKVTRKASFTRDVVANVPTAVSAALLGGLAHCVGKSPELSACWAGAGVAIAGLLNLGDRTNDIARQDDWLQEAVDGYRATLESLGNRDVVIEWKRTNPYSVVQTFRQIGTGLSSIHNRTNWIDTKSKDYKFATDDFTGLKRKVEECHTTAHHMIEHGRGGVSAQWAKAYQQVNEEEDDE